MRKGQVWFIDFMTGILIFVIVIFVYYEYAYNIDEDPSEITTELLMDAKSIGSSLVGPGSPQDWNSSNVEVIGLTDGDQRILEDKLTQLANLSYNNAKTKLRTNYNFYLILHHLNGTEITNFGQQPIDEENLVSLTRILIYQSEIVNLIVQVWT